MENFGGNLEAILSTKAPGDKEYASAILKIVVNCGAFNPVQLH